jgi:hypothetical protein
MEYFGSKPGSPVEECLHVVESCKIYVGIFGMRYGSIPDGYDKSMTHLEYDEAQRLSLPSLVYIIDEENQPLLPKNVETGRGAEKLRDLKAQLKKRHVVSFFTTPEDLRARILHDVPELLRQIGAEVDGELNLGEEQSDVEILRNFQILPKMFSGRQVTIQFATRGEFRSAMAEDCKALGLEMGATVYDSLDLSNSIRFQIFAERDLALRIYALPKDTTIRARAVTAFGVYSMVHYLDDGPEVTYESETGLVIKEIIDAHKPDKA